MPDKFEGFKPGLTSSWTDGDLVTGFTGGRFAFRFTTREIRVGGAGTVVLELSSGTTLTIPNCVAGEKLAARAVAIIEAGTTATHISGHW